VPGLQEVTVVLVHGAFMDGAGWEGVCSDLKKNGYEVSVVQIPTTSRWKMTSRSHAAP